MLTTAIVKTGPPDHPWCLRWRTERMPASAFWYFESEEEARSAERAMLNGRHQAEPDTRRDA